MGIQNGYFMLRVITLFLTVVAVVFFALSVYAASLVPADTRRIR
jgi:hypothetical protein